MKLIKSIILISAYFASKINAQHVVSTFNSNLNYPYKICGDDSGNIYVTDYNRIVKFDQNGNSITIAGSTSTGSTNANGTNATFNLPSGIIRDKNGNFYVADQNNNIIRKINRNNDVTTFAGTGSGGFNDGTVSTCKFYGPTDLCMDKNKNIYIADRVYHLIRKIDTLGNVTTIAGNGTSGNTNGLGTNAQFSGPSGICVNENGQIIIADTDNNLIRLIETSGYVTTLAGTGANGSEDGLGSSASFSRPTGICVDKFNNVYVTDYDSKIIRKINVVREVTTIAGLANQSGFINDTGSKARFTSLTGIYISPKGYLYVTDNGNNSVRLIKEICKFNTQTTVNNSTITVLQNSGTFQWIDCNTNQIIPGETNRTFTPTKTGNYAVILKEEYCIDTTACVSITINTDIKTTNLNNLNLYPNPSQDIITVENAPIGTYQLFDSYGKKINDINLNYENTQIDVSKLSNGVYFIIGNQLNLKFTINK